MADCTLVLEDGAVFRGTAIGAPGTRSGEVVFNTAMTGYQEILTDPSYAGQIVSMTAPHIGNYGVNDEDLESAAQHLAGFVVREVARRHGNPRARSGLQEYVAAAGVVGLSGIDTRTLTHRLRRGGAMRVALSTEIEDPCALLALPRECPPTDGRGLVSSRGGEVARAAAIPGAATRFPTSHRDGGIVR